MQKINLAITELENQYNDHSSEPDFDIGQLFSDIALRFSVDQLILEDAYDQNFYL